MGTVVLGVLGTFVGYQTWRYWSRYRGPYRQISEAAEEAGTTLLANTDVEGEDPEFYLEVQNSFGEEKPRPVKCGAFMRFVAASVVLVKAEYGLLEPTEANRLMVTHVVKRLLTLRNTRKSDIARALPYIIVGVFAPTEADILAKEMQYSVALGKAIARQRARYERRGLVEWMRQWWDEPTQALEFTR